MRQLRYDTHLMLDGEVRVYRCERGGFWLAAVNINGFYNPRRRHSTLGWKSRVILDAIRRLQAPPLGAELKPGGKRNKCGRTGLSAELTNIVSEPAHSGLTIRDVTAAFATSEATGAKNA